MNLLTSLRYLTALDGYKHFGRAAQCCHITQPALSNASGGFVAGAGLRALAAWTTIGSDMLSTRPVIEVAVIIRRRRFIRSRLAQTPDYRPTIHAF